MQKYEIIRNLGRGSYGRVDLVKSKITGDQYALKKVKLGQMKPRDRKQALEEAKFLSKINHPNIVSYKESFQEIDSLYIAMEYIDGGDLEKKIAQRGHSFLPEREILFAFVQVLLALNYLHTEKHILHRDIKPQNCFLTRHGIVKLGDFGVSRELNGMQDLAKTVIGTPFYLAPEMWDHHPYSYAADIYSLGVVLYELCTLKKPFEAENQPELLVKVMKHDHKPLPSFFSNDLRRLVESMIQLDPSLRPTCSEILQMELIQNAIKELAEYNKNQKPEKKSVPKTAFVSSNSKQIAAKKNLGRGRLLHADVISNAANSDSEDVGDDEDNDLKFEDDFIIEDDFIDDEEEDEIDESAFTLLQDVTKQLEQTIIRVNETQSPKEPVDPFKAEDLRERLVNRLGDAKLDKLLISLKNINNKECRDYVKNSENENRNIVEEARELIRLEFY